MTPSSQQATSNEAELHARWESFLRDYYGPVIQEAALGFPETRAVELAFMDLQLRDPALAEELLAHGRSTLRVGTQALRGMDVAVDPAPALNLRVKGLPESLRILPRQLRHEHLGCLVPVQGLVQSMGQVRFPLHEAAFECRFCGNLVHVIQEDELLQEPAACDGCERSGPWKLCHEASTGTDSQYLVIQESPDQLRGGVAPETLHVVCRDDLVHQVQPGDRVIINGIPTPRIRRKGNIRYNDFEAVLHAVSIERDDDHYVDTELTPELEDRFHKLAERQDIHRILAASYLPEVSGMQEAKLAVTFALTGSPTTHTATGKRRRGQIHVLFVGDPGVAKTAILEALDHYAPRVVNVVCTNTSGAGLTAAAEYDEVLRTSVLRAGAAVIADQGVVGMDEFSHMDEEDRVHMYTIMESGIVRYMKVIKAILRAEVTVIAAMNPVVGERFDRYAGAPGEQIGLPSALMSRFDLIFCFLDRPSKDRDRLVARTILQGTSNVDDSQAPVLTPDEYRRYIAYAQTFQPVLEDKAIEVLEDYYVKIRAQDADHPAFTGRQVDGLRRLTLASARLRLSQEATAADARRAIEIMEQSLRSRGVLDAGGGMDGDLLQFGTPNNQNDRNRLVLQVVKDLQRQHEKGYNQGWAREEDIMTEAERHGVSHEDAEKALKDLGRNKAIYCRGGRGTWAMLTG